MNKLIKRNKDSLKKVSKFDEELCDALMCSIYREYRREHKTEFIYKSMFLNVKRNVNFLLDNELKNIIDSKEIYKIFNYSYLFIHPNTNTWIYIPTYSIYNTCGSCDGTTSSSVVVCEEQNIEDIIYYHFDEYLREYFGLNSELNSE